MILFMKVKIYKMRKRDSFQKNFPQLHVAKNFQHTLRRLLFCIYPIS